MRLLFAVLVVFCLLPIPAAAGQQWLVVSDIHLDPYDSSQQPSWYRSDTNWPLFTSALGEMRRVDPDPAVVVIAGDFLAHKWATVVRNAHPNLSPTAAAEQTMERIEEAFAKTFPLAQFVIVLGNNDDPCGDYRTEPASPYLASIARIWAPLVNRRGASPEFLRDFSERAAYTAQLPAHLQAIAIDDIFWSIVYRPCGRAGDSPRAQMQWLTRALNATPRGSRALVVMHIPPGIDPSTTLLTHRFLIVPFLREDWNQALIATLANHRSGIAFAIAGHTHRSGYRIPADVPMLIASAVSPVYENNPGFLRLDVSSDGTPRDYRQYAYDEEEQVWKEQFDFDRAYGVSEFTAKTLDSVNGRIAADPELRAQWAASMINGSPRREIRPSNWRVFWCAQTLFDRAYVACAGAQNRVAVVPIAVALFVALLALICYALWRSWRKSHRSA
jgi:sphingomyelin phosphodiesterase acid-like 3